jgi:starch-binding outer membrane protein, SusD/RagB family
MKMYIIKINFVYIVSVSLLLATGCKKFIQVEAPITTVNGDNVFDTDPNAIAVLTGMYIKMDQDNLAMIGLNTGVSSTSLFCSLSADELTLNGISTSETLKGYYQNDLTPITISSPDFWQNGYGSIFIANSAIEGLNRSTSITPAVKNQLLGEAHFLRAFYYFYLTNLYGNIVVTTETDYTKTSLLSRSDSAKAYALIKSDLQQAQQLLNDNYLSGNLEVISQERTRPNKASATALLARVYLYLNEWNNAELESSKIINNTSSYNISPLNEAFKKNSTETIWAIQPIGLGTQQNTGDGRLFILSNNALTASRPFHLSEDLLNAFESGDQRFTSWTRTSVIGGTPILQAYKYQVGSVNTPTVEYPIILRLAEQYLIRAEARIWQNNIAGGAEDLNIIRTRARGTADATVLPDLSSSISQDEALDAVYQERRVELFTEWGHRWFDLRRAGKIDAVMSEATIRKGGTWESKDAYYPITRTEILSAPNLEQTSGY